MVQLLKDGAVTQEYAYDAYGCINADEFGIQAPFYGYNGEEQNPFTGLQYLRARYYAPQNGGFITQDSFSGVLDDALTQNRYTYAGNNPLNNIDPSGHRYVKGIEIGDNLKSSSAKKQPTTSGRPLSPGLTGAVVKKTTTNKKAPAISGSIAANAALSAARAGVPVGASSAVVNAIRQDPYVPWTNAAGQTLMLPGHFSDMQSAALQHILQRCDPNANHISASQQEYPMGKITIGGKDYPIYVPEHVANMVSTIEQPWTTVSFQENKFKFDPLKFVTGMELEETDREAIYAGRYELVSKQITNQSTLLNMGLASVTLGMLNSFQESAENLYISVELQERGEERRAIIMAGSSAQYKQYQEVATGVSMSLYWTQKDQGDALGSAVVSSSAGKIYQELTGKEPLWYGTYDVEVTIDPQHKDTIYSSYLWYSEDGTLMGAPILYPEDKAEVGIRSGFLGLGFDTLTEIPLDGSSPAQAVYQDLLDAIIKRTNG